MPSALTAPQALLGIENLTYEQAQNFIDKAISLKSKSLIPARKSNHSAYDGDKVPNVALIFFEASTRTRFSFEMAAKKLCLNTIAFTASSSTSVSKGESQHETLNTLMRMHPDLLVVRHPGDAKIAKILNSSHIPVINAGDGKGEHPTQALLDAMTIIENSAPIKGQKIVFVGDVEHSRVARSGRILFQLMGAEVAVCAPTELLPRTSDWSGVKQFTSMKEAVAWCTVCMGLRLQKERHDREISLSQEEYVQKYRLDKKNLQGLSSKALIMHPGPFVSDIDLDEELLLDERCVIHEQVENGVFVRMAVMGEIFGLLST